MVKELTKLAKVIGDAEHPWAATTAVMVVVAGVVLIATVRLF